ncbi:MAG: glyoxalase superfamily protein [Pseudomonadota bacterium]
MTDDRFENATPVLAVADYARAKSFYADALGFTVMEEGGDPPGFGIVRCGKALIFLDGWTTPTPPQTCWTVYIHVRDINSVRADLKAQGVSPGEIRHTAYGMREFDVTDPDGHILCFGEDMDGEKAQ